MENIKKINSKDAVDMDYSTALKRWKNVSYSDLCETFKTMSRDDIAFFVLVLIDKGRIEHRDTIFGIPYHQSNNK